MAFTRISVAQALKQNLNDKDELVSILNRVGAAGEATAVAEGYADLIARGLNFQEPDVVAAACTALANMGMAGLDYMTDIAALIGESNATVRAAAVEALGGFGYEARDYAPRVASIVTTDTSDFVKAAAIRMLGNVGADEEAAVIKGNLESSNDEVASSACEAMGKLGLLGESGAVLTRMLKKPSTCWSALVALADMGYQAPMEALESVITIGLAKEDSNFRDLAVSIVANLTEAAAREPFLGSLKAALSHSSPGARAAGAMAFGSVAFAAQANVLLPLLEDDGEETSGPQIAQVVGTSAKRTSPCCRLPKAAALWALSQMKASQYLSKMRDSMNDKNWEVRLTALDSVATLGPSAKEIAPTVAAQLTDPAFPVRASAAHALGQMGADGQAEDLAQALLDQSHSVRLSAVLALAELGEDAGSYSHDVFKLVQDPMVPVRAAAVRCLSAMGDIGCNYAGVLATLLSQAEPEVRAEVLDALGRMGSFGISFVEDVAECLYDKNPMVSEAAMRSLMSMGAAGKPYLVSSGYLAASEPTKLPSLLPPPSLAQKGYVSALERERAKLGI